jgi:hypothetical protein
VRLKAVETTIADAIDVCKRDEFPIKAACSRYYCVDYQVFLARLNKRPSKRQTRPPYNRLTYNEEKAFVQFMSHLANLGVYGNMRKIETAANSLISKHSNAGPFEPVSKHWTQRFF